MLADDDDTTPSDEPLGKALTIWEGTETTLSKATQLPPQHHPTQNPPSGTRKHREKERERSDRVNINTSLPDGWPNLARRWHWTELSSLPISGADDCNESLSILPKWRGGGISHSFSPLRGDAMNDLTDGRTALYPKLERSNRQQCVMLMSYLQLLFSMCLGTIELPNELWTFFVCFVSSRNNADVAFFKLKQNH